MPNAVRVVEDLFTAHRGELLAFAERRLGARAPAEDLVQQASLRALEGAERLRDPRSGRAWLFKITRRLLADHARRGFEFPLTSEPNAPADEAEAFGCACVLANVQHLNPEHALVLRRAIFEGVSMADLAAELGLTANAATVRVSRARGALREQLRNHCGTDSLRACLDCVCDERGCCASTHHESDREAVR
jgi:RNA polymerase sigma factor (sigma-70 family)